MDWKAPKVKTSPALEPCAVADVKTLLGLDASNTSFDAMLSSFITAARSGVEGACKRSLITQTLTRDFDSFPSNGGALDLPLPPVQSIVSISYLDSSGAAQTLSSSSYVADLNEPRPCVRIAFGESWPETYPKPNAVTVEYKAGYGDAASNVPAPLRVCINSLVADLFEHREANLEVASLVESRTYKFLLAQYLIPGVA